MKQTIRGENMEKQNIKDLQDCLQTIPTKLLSLIAKGIADAVDLSTTELESRGVDRDGNWVGFKKGGK